MSKLPKSFELDLVAIESLKISDDLKRWLRHNVRLLEEKYKYIAEFTNSGGFYTPIWRAVESSSNLLIQENVSGTWTTRVTFLTGGGIRIGDSTNYTQIASDGEITLAGTARINKYMVISAAALQRGSSAPDVGTEGTFGTLLFASNQTEEAYFNVHIPPDWAVGTDLELAIYWAPTNGNAGTVAWEFDWESVASESNEALGAGSTHVDIHDSTQSLDNELLETPYGTISGSALAVDDTIGIHLYRDHDDAEDDYGADAALIHVEIEYIADKLGEAT